MDYKKYIQMIDEYLQEPNNINREWVECLKVCRSGLERMRPKKPIHNEKDNIRFSLCYNCPECGRTFSGTGIADYCYHCGQYLDWRDDNG